MGISQDMIDSLFESPPKPVAEKTGLEKPGLAKLAEKTAKDASDREHSRVPFRGRATAVVFPPSSKTSLEAVESEVLTTDISRGGLSVLYRKQLQPGQQILLMLTESSRMVEVCWCCEVWPGLYAAGCRFMDATPTGPSV